MISIIENIKIIPDEPLHNDKLVGELKKRLTLYSKRVVSIYLMNQTTFDMLIKSPGFLKWLDKSWQKENVFGTLFGAAVVNCKKLPDNVVQGAIGFSSFELSEGVVV